MPASTPSGLDAPDTDHGLRREHARWIANLEAIRKMQSFIQPGDVPTGMSQTELSQRMLMDMIEVASLSRGVVAMQAEALEGFYASQLRLVELREQEVEIARRAAAKADREAAGRHDLEMQKAGVMTKAVGAIGHWFGNIFYSERVKGVAIGAVVTVIGALVTWAVTYLSSMPGLHAVAP